MLNGNELVMLSSRSIPIATTEAALRTPVNLCVLRGEKSAAGARERNLVKPPNAPKTTYPIDSTTQMFLKKCPKHP